MFSTGKPIFEPEHFKEAADCAGMNINDIDNALNMINDPLVKDRLKATTAKAYDLGAVGVPTIVFKDINGKTHTIWGSDRLECISFFIGEKYHGPLAELSKY